MSDESAKEEDKDSDMKQSDKHPFVPADEATVKAGDQGHEFKSAKEQAQDDIKNIEGEVDRYELDFKHCTIRKIYLR